MSKLQTSYSLTSILCRKFETYKKATKLLPKISLIKYSDRLNICKPPTLHYRRIRGDMVETYISYKILSGKYELAAIPNLTTSTTVTT